MTEKVTSKRQQVLKRLRDNISRGVAIVGGGAGVGLSAKIQEAGGIDLIILYNSGRYRMAGRGSLAGLMPYGDANAIMLEMARETLTIVKDTAVLAGICGTDPFRDMPQLLKEVKDLGFTGVQNFPTVGLIDGVFRQNLEETGMSYEKEVEMIRMAHELDLLTTPYVFNVDEAERMARAGADVIVAHMGLTTSGTIGAKTALALDDCVVRIKRILDAAVKIKPEIIVLCHGGPIATPPDAKYVIERVPGIHGFFGASSLERLPVESAMKEVAREFKAIGLPSRLHTMTVL
ncbi:TIM-barrel-protein domain-containing protein [Suillus plorans]|uniref:TIM-barrel-protein domain-containing protein n=1 Tax=Suillus plorans TaxID=116603 RepID=A0A9P7DQU2_9AGAM|nr:TIM-barrel-protein domain-containing protein [Suillus plorans]KAG1800885.1 TIM-barrel-protein domain-containing protein [Suillus plorans]